MFPEPIFLSELLQSIVDDLQGKNKNTFREFVLFLPSKTASLLASQNSPKAFFTNTAIPLTVHRQQFGRAFGILCAIKEPFRLKEKCTSLKKFPFNGIKSI